jgi:hypothetical protein
LGERGARNGEQGCDTTASTYEQEVCWDEPREVEAELTRWAHHLERVTYLHSIDEVVGYSSPRHAPNGDGETL